MSIKPLEDLKQFFCCYNKFFNDLDFTDFEQFLSSNVSTDPKPVVEIRVQQ